MARTCGSSACTCSGISSLIGAINFICTIHNMRAPGMRLSRLPLFTWAIDVYSVMIVAAGPVLAGALTMLLLDRNYGTHFYDPAHNGNVLLYQHLFWFYSHPVVYVMALPGFGMISEIIPVFSRKPLFGYKALVYSVVAIAFLGFLVWGHHMFAVGFSEPLQVWFMLVSMSIAVPTGVKIFNWIGTMWMGQLRFEPPMLFAVGFIGLFMIGGLSGILLAIYPFDQYVTDSYFVVAHFHYVLGTVPVFAVMAGLHFWFPKFTGRMLDRTLALWSFWIMFIGFNMTFFPMHAMGLSGMPRRDLHLHQHDLDDLQPDRHPGLVHPRHRRPDRAVERALVAARRPPGRLRPVGWKQPRVVHHVTAAGAQLRPPAADPSRSGPCTTPAAPREQRRSRRRPGTRLAPRPCSTSPPQPRTSAWR